MSTPTPLVLLKAVNYSGSGAWLDESGYGRNATIEVGTASKNSAGNGIVLNGSTGWSFPSPGVGNSWSVNLWYKKTGIDNVNGFILAQSDNSNIIVGHRGLNADVFNVGYFSNGWNNTKTFTLGNGQWTNIQATWDGINMSIYINGVLLGTTQPGGTGGNSNVKYFIGSRSNSYFTIGEIGEVRIYNTPLTQAQVTADYNSSYSNYFTPSTFNPTNIVGCQLWLDAKDPLATGTAPANGTGITTWSDKSGNARNGTANSAITYNTTGLRGYPTLTFPGNRWFLGSTTVTGPGITVFSIASMNSSTAVAGRIIGMATGPGEYDCFSTPAIAIMRISGGIGIMRNSVQTPGTSTSFATPYLFESWADGTNLYNTAQIGSSTTITTTASTGNFGINSYSIGSGTATSDGNGLFNGNISEVIVYNRVLSTVERQYVEGYLSWKWGLQTNLLSTNPYYTAPPAPVLTMPNPLVMLRAINYSSGTWNDESGFGRNATIEAGTAIKNTAGNGIVLNGSTVWTFPNPALGNAWTASIWYKKTGAQTGHSDILSQKYAGGSSMNLVIGHIDSNNNVFGGFYGANAWKKGTGFTLTNGSWTNMQITWNGTNMSTYINGSLLGTTTPGGTAVDIGTAYRIGGDWNDNSTNIIGEIGEVRLYNTALTDLQLATLYNSSSAVYAAPSPLVLLRGVDYTSGAWLDKSGYARNATIANGLATKNTAGNGLVLNGSTSWSFPNVAAGNAWTLATWFKLQAVPTSYPQIVGQLSSPKNNMVINSGPGAGQFNATFFNSTWASATFFGLTVGAWTNIQATWDGTKLTLYINGIFRGTTTPGIVSADNGTPYFIGRDVGNNYIVGEIGEVRIYGTPLTQAQVTADYQSGLNTYIATAPTAITAVSYPSLEGTSFVANWTGGYGATSYTYTINGSAATPSVDNGVASQTATFTGLTSSTTYSLGITGTNATGNVTYYSSVTTATLAPTAPVITFSGLSTTSFIASWTGATGATSYTYTLNGIPLTPASQSVAGKTATFSGLAVSTTYSVGVTATNSVGSASSSASITTYAAVLSGTGAPTNLVTANSTNIYVDTSNGDLYKYAGAVGTVSDFTSSSAGINRPFAIASDASGNLYVSDYNNSVWRKIDASGVLTTFAGIVGQQNTNPSTISGVATSIKFWTPRGVARDSSGNTYLADENNRCIFKVDPSGNVALFAGGRVDGNGYAISGTTNGDALTVATFQGPIRVACDASNNVYVLDANIIRKVSNGVVSTLATNAQISFPSALCVDPSGNVYVTENNGTNGVRKIDPSGNITSFAGSGAGYLDGSRLTAKFTNPEGITCDPSGNLYVADTGNNRIRKIDTAGNVTTLAGNGVLASANAVGTAASFNRPYDITFTRGNLYVADYNSNNIRKVLLSSWALASSGSTAITILGAPDSSLSASVNQLCIDTTTGDIYTYSGLPTTVSNFTAIGAGINRPFGMASDASGNLYIADYNNSVWRKVDASGNLTTFAGIVGQQNTNPSTISGVATSIKFWTPRGVARDSSGNTYLADENNRCIFKVDPSGNVALFAGGTVSGGTGVSGTANGAALSATFQGPIRLACDASNNVYVLDSNMIRKVSNGVVSTVATNAQIAWPSALCVDPSGNIYVTENNAGHGISKIDPSGNITSFAGSGAGYLDGDRLTAKFNTPEGITCDTSGNLYVADTANNRIRKIDASGNVTTIAGNGTASNINAVGTTATFNKPYDITFTQGDLYVADFNTNVVRKVLLKPWVFTAAAVMTSLPLPTTVFPVISNIGPNSFVASWSGGVGASSYTFTLNGTAATPSTDNALSGKSVTFTGLTDTTSYSLVITAVNGFGTTPATSSITTLIPFPTAPVVTVTNLKDTTFTVSYTSNGTSYTYTLNGNAVTPSVSGLTATFNGLTASTNYSLVVNAVNSTGPTPTTTAITTMAPPPTTPVVSLGSVSDTSFVATWTGGVGATSYTYTLNGTAATPSTDNGVAGKSATFTGLNASTSYTLVVTAINSTNPTNSVQTTANTLIPRPTVPVVTISSVRDSTFVASWTGGATATSYSYTLNGSAATPSINNALASQTVTFTGLQFSTAYTLIVTASNGTGPTASVATIATTLIAPPTLPVVTIGSIRDTSFVASWTGGLRATSYTYTLNGSSVTPSTDNGVASNTATFTGLTASTTYTLIVTAINSTNPTTSAGVSMNTLIPPPTKPDSLNITSITDTSFVANWTGGDPATSYTYTINGSAVTPAIDNGVNGDNATFTGLTPDTNYTLLVTAIDSTGPTTSDPISVTTLPLRPSIPVVTIGTISDTYFMVTWTGGLRATSYTYTLNGNNVTADVDDCLCGEATFTGLTAETDYTFVVTAVNVSGTTSSASSSLRTLLSRPTKPMPTIVLLSDSICSVSWTGGVGAISYSYTLNGEAATPTIDNGLNGQLTFTGLSANTTYALMVAAINSTGPRYSSPLNFTTLPPPPTVPVVTITKVTALGFVARWTGGVGATSYTYTLNGTPATPSIDNGLTGRATFTGLTPNTPYSLVVKARNVTTTTLSDIATLTTLTSPTKPTDLSATVTASSFTVSWTGASDVTSYTYLLNGAPFTPIDNGVLNQTATFTGLASLITYKCVVIASNVHGTAMSDELSVRTAAAPPQVTSGAVTQLTSSFASANIADPEVAASVITAALATSSSATVISAALALPSPALFTALVNNPNLVGATVTIPSRAAATLYNNAQDTTHIDRSLPLTVTIPAADGSLPAPAIGRNTKMAIDVTVNTYTPFRGSTGYGVRVVNGIQKFVSPGKEDVVINVGDLLTLVTDSGATINFTVADLDLFVVPYNPPSIVCFLGSAPVLTPSGYRRIDRIQVGDIVVTPTGTAVVELVKKQSYKPSPASNPYVIPEGKFGANRKLLISPRHKVAVGGNMIEARDLGLEQEAQKGTIIYYNIQITKRQNMFVAGVEVESLAALIRVTISNEEFMKILNTKFGGQLTDEIKAKCRFLGYGVSVPAMI